MATRWLRLWSSALLIASVCPCGHVATAREQSGLVSLGILGYNYTNRYVDYFSVDGRGGGNIQISSPSSGGSGIVCCAMFSPRAPFEKVHIRWQSGACYYSKQSSLSKQMLDKIHLFYKEQDVPVDILASADAKYLEVHFYPDGSIKVAVTHEMSSPRLSLNQQRKDSTPYPRCLNDREPTE